MSDVGDAEAYFWIDNCETAYHSEEMDGHGDVGRNISDHPESHVAGFSDPRHFDEMMEQVAERDDVSHSSQLVWWLANRSRTDNLEDVWDVATDAQHPDDYGDGFEHFSWYMNERPVSMNVVTAAPRYPVSEALESRMNGYSPDVIGGELKQNGDGIEVEAFCGGQEKADRIREELGVDPGEVPGFAFGNSPGDRPMMEPAEESFGRDRAYDFATVYTEDGPDFWTQGSLGVAAYALESGKDVEEASEAVINFLDTGTHRHGDVRLDEIERGGRESGRYTEEIMEAYDTALQEVESW